MSTTAAIVAIKRKKIIQRFREANAVSEASAISAADHNIRRSFIFKRLMSEGIILPAGKEIYYLDEERERQVTKNNRKKVLLIAAILAAVALACLYFANR